MTPTSVGPYRAAENALWQALEERRGTLRAAGLPFSERQHHQFRQAHAAGTLLSGLCSAMENYKSPGDHRYLTPMAHALKRNLETVEDVLIRRGGPWTAYVTARARRGARTITADARELIPFV